jgi:hypothetical protein
MKTFSFTCIVCLVSITGCNTKGSFYDIGSASSTGSTAASAPSDGAPTKSSPVPSPSPTTPVFKPPGTVVDGLAGGHFDLDTSSLVYAYDEGKTGHHVHEFDDVYKTNGADFFNLPESGLTNISSGAGQKRFVLMVTNAQLSQSAVLEINGTKYNAHAYQNYLQSLPALPVYTIGLPTVAGDIQLKSLKMFFPLDSLQKNGLVPTQTGCVKGNKSGAHAEYRDGALMIQAMNAEAYSIDSITKAAAWSGGGLLWESTMFWHRDGTSEHPEYAKCYGDPTWVP